MKSRIEKIENKKLVGVHMEMSISNNKTSELWQRFMAKKTELKNRVNSDFISMQVYGKNQKNHYAPTTLFKKWAVVEVSSHKDIPKDMEAYSMKGGKYAVFTHKGPANEFPKTMEAIFKNWFPKSGYKVDDREHFEILPENYNPIDLEAREEIWIPVKLIL